MDNQQKENAYQAREDHDGRLRWPSESRFRFCGGASCGELPPHRFQEIFYGEWAKLAEQAHEMRLVISPTIDCKDHEEMHVEEILRVYHLTPYTHPKVVDSRIVLQPPHYLRNEKCDKAALFCSRIINLWWVSPIDFLRICLEPSPESMEGVMSGVEEPSFLIKFRATYPGKDNPAGGRTLEPYWWHQSFKLPFVFDGSFTREETVHFLDDIVSDIVKEVLKMSRDNNGRPWQESLEERARIEAEMDDE